MNPTLSNYMQTVQPETVYSEKERRLHGNLLSPAEIKRRGYGLLDLCMKTSPNNFQGKQ